MTWARSSSKLTAALRNLRFTRPKQALGENLVWPVIMKCSWMEVCRPVMTRQSRYCTIVLFLFCPLQLSACRLALVSPRLWWLKKKSSMLTTVFAPFPVSLASSITKFTCRGIASQPTPNMAAFQEVDRAGLEGITGIVNLLGKVEGVVDGDFLACIGET